MPLIIRGDTTTVNITPAMAEDLANQGWRWSAHTQPGDGLSYVRSSYGDRAVLGAMQRINGQDQSAILNSVGQRGLFTPKGDMHSGSLP